MADIRFKICGDNPPFLINVHDGTTSSDLIICTTTLSYSGETTTSKDACFTCAIINRLESNTSYLIDISDSIGNTDQSVFLTPPEVVPPPPIIKEINLGGTINTISPTIQALSGNKTLITDPSLDSGESYEVEFCLDTTIVGGFRSTSATAILYCSSNGGASYSEITRATNGDDDSVWVPVSPNDIICYDLSSQVSTAGDNITSASIEITNTRNLIGIDSVNIMTPSRLEVRREFSAITTTTTTIPTIDVYFDGAAIVQSTTGVQDLKKYRPIVFDNLDSTQTAAIDVQLDGFVTKTSGLDFTTVIINYRTDSSDSFEPKTLWLFDNRTELIEGKMETLNFTNIKSTDVLEIQVIISDAGNNATTLSMTLVNARLTTTGTGPTTIQVTNPAPPNFSNVWVETTEP